MFMNFLTKIFRWFFNGNREIVPVSQSVSTVERVPEQPEIPEVKSPKEGSFAPNFDYLKENDPQTFLRDLQSIRPVSEQFNQAREELVRELQRLAPPKKRLLDIFRKVA